MEKDRQNFDLAALQSRVHKSDQSSVEERGREGRKMAIHFVSPPSPRSAIDRHRALIMASARAKRHWLVDESKYVRRR